jgi:hypothetical protein
MIPTMSAQGKHPHRLAHAYDSPPRDHMYTSISNIVELKEKCIVGIPRARGVDTLVGPIPQ